VAEQFKAKICGSSFAEIAGSNPAGGMDVCVVSLYSQGQKAKPGQSGHRSADKVQRTNKQTNKQTNKNSRGGGGGMEVCLV
jgi:uncharacterized protein YaiL (DUF2058 family)